MDHPADVRRPHLFTTLRSPDHFLDSLYTLPTCTRHCSPFLRRKMALSDDCRLLMVCSLHHHIATLSDDLPAAPSLTLRASPGQGMHVHVSRKTHASQLKKDKDFVSLSESGSTCTFFHQGWSRLAMQINETAFAIVGAEREAFEILRNEACSTCLTTLFRSHAVTDHFPICSPASECPHHRRA